MMTLLEWSNEYNRPVYRVDDTGMHWVHDNSNDGRVRLWSLFDYRVVSVSAGVIWLDAREPKTILKGMNDYEPETSNS